jgi:hypothetical protein
MRLAQATQNLQVCFSLEDPWLQPNQNGKLRAFTDTPLGICSF